MKFLFIAPRFHTNQYFIVKILQKKGHNVAFFVRDKNKASEKHDILEPIVIRRFLNLGYFRKIKKLNPDIIVVRDPNKLFSLVTLLMARILKIKNILIYTQGPLCRKQNLKTKMNKIFLTVFKAKWITPVLGEKEKYEKFDKRAYYLPFTIEPIIKSFKDKQFFLDGNINIISVGKLNLPRKNIILLFEAIKKLKNEFPLHLTVIGFLENEKGEHYLKTLNFVEENNLSDIITIKKNIDLFEVYEEYKKNDLFILPSSNEPAAYSIIEAMACGLPVISSDTNGTSCYIEEGRTGYIFKSNDLNDLIKKICLIISDKNKLLKMGEESCSLAIKNHNPESFYKKFMGIIK